MEPCRESPLKKIRDPRLSGCAHGALPSPRLCSILGLQLDPILCQSPASRPGICARCGAFMPAGDAADFGACWAEYSQAGAPRADRKASERCLESNGGRLCGVREYPGPETHWSSACWWFSCCWQRPVAMLENQARLDRMPHLWLPAPLKVGRANLTRWSMLSPLSLATLGAASSSSGLRGKMVYLRAQFRASYKTAWVSCGSAPAMA